MSTSRILRGTSALLAIACAPGCGPSTAPPAMDASGTSSGASSSDAASGASASGTSSPPDAGPGLPEGCGDGVSEPGQFCFELVRLAERRTSGAAAFDLDADGTDELLVELDEEPGDGPCGGESDFSTCTHVFRWDGRGFVEIGQIPTGLTSDSTYHPNLDFDDDGWVDLVTKSEGHGVGVAWNKNGEMLEPAFWSPSWEVPEGDWYRGGAFPFKADGKGYTDLLVAFDAGLQVHVREEDTWVPKGPMLPSPNCLMYPAARADLDEDGIEDVIVMGAYMACDWGPLYEEDPSFFGVFPYRSNPDTGLLDPWPLILPGAPVDDLWVRDFDGDGHFDVLFTMIRFGGGEIYGTTWVRGHGDGTFSEAILLPTVGDVLDPGDFDGDGDLDLLVRWEREFDYDVGILEDLSPPTELTYRLSAEDPEDVTSHYPQCVGDFNGDGVTDVVVKISTKLDVVPYVEDETAVWLSRP